MAENRFKARQQKRAVEEESRLEQAKGGTTSVSAKKSSVNLVPLQFYMTNDMKKRLKMYCLSNDTKLTDVLNKITDDFLKSNGF